jgi:hypothetical protein
MEQHFRRHDGEPFDPLYFRGGEPLGEGWYRLEDAFFLEAAAGDDALVFEWANSEYRIDVSTRDAEDIAFLVVDGVDDPPDELVVVMVRERSLGARLGALFRPRKQVVVERNVTASRVA